MFNQYFGNYLLEKKIIRPEELRQVLEEQKSVKVKLGILAIDSGYMNAAQVEKIHKLQTTRDKKFGELALEEGYLTREHLEGLLNAQKRSNVLLGQILIEKGIFTLEKYEEVMLKYRQDSRMTEEEMEALKNSDIKKIAEMFLKTLSGDPDERLSEYLELFIRNLIRFIDGEIRVETAQETETYSFDFLVWQPVEGEQPFFSGFAASEAVLTKFASIYADEAIIRMDDMARDSLGEFLNCQNGLFLSHLSDQGTLLELLPGEVKENGTLLKTAEKLFVIPCHLSFGRIDFLFAGELPYFA
jgi:hypothetical protein